MRTKNLAISGLAILLCGVLSGVAVASEVVKFGGSTLGGEFSAILHRMRSIHEVCV